MLPRNRSMPAGSPEWRPAAARTQQSLPSPAFLSTTMPDGTPWMTCYRRDSGYLVRFEALADFEISRDGMTLTSYASPGVSAQTIEHLYQNQAMPLALSLQKKLVLHGSAIEMDGRAIAFLAESGRGKSTLAASFSSNGYRFLTDDGLFIDRKKNQYFVRPGHPSIRLWDDSRTALVPVSTRPEPPVDYNAKSRFLAGDQFLFGNIACQLGFVFFLGDGSSRDVSITSISGQEVVIETIRHCFLLGVDEHEMLKDNFNQLADLSRLPIFFKLDYPRRYDILDRVRDAVVKHIGLG